MHIKLYSSSCLSMLGNSRHKQSYCICSWDWYYDANTKIPLTKLGFFLVIVAVQHTSYNFNVSLGSYLPVFYEHLKHKKCRFVSWLSKKSRITSIGVSKSEI